MRVKKSRGEHKLVPAAALTYVSGTYGRVFDTNHHSFFASCRVASLTLAQFGLFHFQSRHFNSLHIVGSHLYHSAALQTRANRRTRTPRQQRHPNGTKNRDEHNNYPRRVLPVTLKICQMPQMSRLNHYIRNIKCPSNGYMGDLCERADEHGGKPTKTVPAERGWNDNIRGWTNWIQ